MDERHVAGLHCFRHWKGVHGKGRKEGEFTEKQTPAFAYYFFGRGDFFFARILIVFYNGRRDLCGCVTIHASCHFAAILDVPFVYTLPCPNAIQIHIYNY